MFNLKHEQINIAHKQLSKVSTTYEATFLSTFSTFQMDLRAKFLSLIPFWVVTKLFMQLAHLFIPLCSVS
jgi:hypothetical protein